MINVKNTENFQKNSNIIENEKNKTKKIVENVISVKNYKEELENIIPKLKKIGLEINENGDFDFRNLKGHRFWPSINGRKLGSFPSKNFNIKNGIGNNKGVIQGKKDLAKLFETLGFSINKEIFKEFNKKEEIIPELQKIIPELEKIGLKIDKNGTFDFSKLENEWRNLKINGKYLSSFPNKNFNKENGIGNKNGILTNKTDLARLFNILDFPVNKDIFLKFENQEEEKKFYKSELENFIPELKKIGLKIDEKGNLELSDLIHKWREIKINGKSLGVFPNTIFNQKNGLGDKKGFILSKKDLRKMLIFYGFSVNLISEKNNFDTENYKSSFEEIIPELQKLGLKINENGSFDFSELKGDWRFIKINGIRLENFPNSKFLRRNRITSLGLIQNSIQLAKLFEILGFKEKLKKED